MTGTVATLAKAEALEATVNLKASNRVAATLRLTLFHMTTYNAVWKNEMDQRSHKSLPESEFEQYIPNLPNGMQKNNGTFLKELITFTF